jgi:hypothetical protein
MAARCRLRRAGVRGDGQGPRCGEDGLLQGRECKISEKGNSSLERGLFSVKSGVFFVKPPERAGSSRPRAALRGSGPPRVLGLDLAGSGCARRCARVGRAGSLGFPF